MVDRSGLATTGHRVGDSEPEREERIGRGLRHGLRAHDLQLPALDELAADGQVRLRVAKEHLLAGLVPAGIGKEARGVDDTGMLLILCEEAAAAAQEPVPVICRLWRLPLARPAFSTALPADAFIPA